MILERPTVKKNLLGLNVIGVFVKSYVGPLARKAHQIFNAVVVFFLVHVMDNFTRLKISAKGFFNSKSMLKHVASIGKRMFRGVNSHIAQVMHRFSSIPMAAFFSRHSFFEFSQRRKMYSFFTLAPRCAPFFKTPRIRVTFFTEKPSDVILPVFISNHSLADFFLNFIRQTPKFPHISSRIKKAVFSGLSKTVRFSRLLTASIQGIKNPFSIDTVSIPLRSLTLCV